MQLVDINFNRNNEKKTINLKVTLRISTFYLVNKGREAGELLRKLRKKCNEQHFHTTQKPFSMGIIEILSIRTMKKAKKM